MRAAAVVSIGVALAAGCGEAPSVVAPQAVVEPAFARAPSSTFAAALTFADDPTHGIRSDGLSGKVLGIVSGSTYATGECNVTGSISATSTNSDLTMDILNAAGKGKSACTPTRNVRISLGAPVVAGDPTFGTVATKTHIKLQGIALVTAASGPTPMDGGFNQLVGAGDCATVRFNRNFGADALVVTRTKTRGAGSDRNEWAVTTAPDADRAACINASGVVLRLYHLPVSFTVTQNTY